MSKLEEIIKEIGKKQLARFDEKAAKHNPGTEYDVASDNYDWDNDPISFWRLETGQHVYKLIGAIDKPTENNYARERMAIIDLMNVLTAYHHKLELEDQE